MANHHPFSESIPNEIIQETMVQLGKAELMDVLDVANENTAVFRSRLRRLGRAYADTHLVNREAATFLFDQQSPIGGLLKAARDFEENFKNAHEDFASFMALDPNDPNFVKIASQRMTYIDALAAFEQKNLINKIAKVSDLSSCADLMLQASKFSKDLKYTADLQIGVADKLVQKAALKFRRCVEENTGLAEKFCDAIVETCMNGHKNHLPHDAITGLEHRIIDPLNSSLDRYYDRHNVTATERMSFVTDDLGDHSLVSAENVAIQHEAGARVVQAASRTPRDLLKEASALSRRLNSNSL